jgi:hypothetical protein
LPAPWRSIAITFTVPEAGGNSSAPFPGAAPGSFELVIQLRGVNGRARL